MIFSRHDYGQLDHSQLDHSQLDNIDFCAAAAVLIFVLCVEHMFRQNTTTRQQSTTPCPGNVANPDMRQQE